MTLPDGFEELVRTYYNVDPETVAQAVLYTWMLHAPKSLALIERVSAALPKVPTQADRTQLENPPRS